MRVIILGAGTVGTTLVTQLVNESHDVSVVDHNADLLTELSNHLDIKTVCGQASYPDVMREAGAEDADMIVAVTDNDEVNMVACQVAYSLFNVPLKIARIRTPHYFIRKELYSNDNLPIDVFINPEVLVTRHIRQLIEIPGASQVLDFFVSKAKMVMVRLSSAVAWLHHTLSQCLVQEKMARIVAVHREGAWLALAPDLLLLEGDEVYFIASNQVLPDLLPSIFVDHQPCRHLMIAGGGHVGFRLANRLSSEYSVKVIDHSRSRCQELTSLLDHTLVLCGEASDQAILLSEAIDQVDMFCAVTDSDEANIISCMQAKRLGAKRTMALINRSAYMNLIDASQVDILLNPQGVTVSGILAHLRKGNWERAYPVQHGNAEVIEVVAEGDSHLNVVVGRTCSDLGLPETVVPVAIQRGRQLLFDIMDVPIELGDHVVWFVQNKQYLQSIEKLFDAENHD